MNAVIEENLKRMSRCYQVILDLTCEAVIENSKADFQSNLESWETFEARTRAKLNKNTERLHKRFSSGFLALIEEIAEKPSGPQQPPSA